MHELTKTLEEEHLAHVYYKFPVTMVRGQGATLWDVQGRSYIDCSGGYGAALVGHCNPRVVEAIKKQSEKLIACHGSLYNDARSELIERLVKIAPKNLDTIFLSNSGSEAVECAIKLARRYTGRKEILAMSGAYHGKTMGSLSATWSEKYREKFQPLVPGFSFARFGDLSDVASKLSENTAAVIIEPIQGESGVIPPPPGFLQGLRQLCDEKNSLLIYDEVQCGLGRTGQMWAYQHWDAHPDILCVAKGIAGGLPLGVTYANAQAMSSLGVGEHTTTFGGGPVVCAAASATIDEIIDGELVERARIQGASMKSALEVSINDLRIVKEIRGLGFMLAVELRLAVKEILFNCLASGLILLYSGRNTLRFLPPLVIEKEQIEASVDIVSQNVKQANHEHTGRRV